MVYTTKNSDTRLCEQKLSSIAMEKLCRDLGCVVIKEKQVIRINGANEKLSHIDG